MEELQENIQQARDFALKNNYDSSLVATFKAFII